MRATARVDRTLCLGAGLCQGMGADLFLLDEEGIAVVRPADGDGGEDRTERLQEIADCCPTGAITVLMTDD